MIAIAAKHTPDSLRGVVMVQVFVWCAEANVADRAVCSGAVDSFSFGWVESPRLPIVFVSESRVGWGPFLVVNAMILLTLHGILERQSSSMITSNEAK